MGTTPGVADIDMKLEVVVIPVSDVARAEEFYGRLGWRSDQTPPGSGVVQLTPHGSACSVHFGTNLTTAAPGSARSFLIVSDIEQVHDALVAAGVQVSDVFHLGPDGPVKGPDPDRGTYRSRAEFADPDGNTWVLQEITDRLPGRVDPGATAFNSATDLATAMRRASLAHGEHEKRIGAADPDWPDWYAAYMVAEASGAPLPQ
ncbi:VOC family protein [Catellatospora chokoriensis]|uniref:Glyoxalase n=1 Tax=Catellatospora chokoriensis TaxID=310353 RepID=A0A8J3NTU9_9ACTN|nr:VOC family protein [Catellatospora chokoriensis]GIF92412.1 glyoxalase [Catellatospora chokoriensis]